MNNKFSFSKKNVDSTPRKESTGPTSSKRIFMLSKIRKRLPSKSGPRRFRRETTSAGQKYSKIDKDRAVVVVVPESEIGGTDAFESEFSSSGSPVSTTSTSTTTTAYTEGGSGADDLNVVDAKKTDNNTASNDTTAIITTMTATDNAETKEDLVENIDEEKMTEPILEDQLENVDFVESTEENEDQQEIVDHFMQSTEEQILSDCSSIILKEEETNTDNIVSFKEAFLAPLIMMALLVALIRVMSSIHQISNI
eukprot:CAMPEP_0113466376 /NCGR_PEP_ID=MMETSP0014_2-20120614/14238_1 /TAXON_ID=2857 /ORGANISM="Nitzschia sp." /LENGTH=252 /DNA_ID=CAMNT_0000358593 /DNA_START=336 /DNA_END=1094 /DNA_ORIENTATION=- /assembly_acc=CAM_ASM_000159